MKQHLQKIDFLRGIAILMVFTYHSEIALFPDTQINSYKSDGIINTSGSKSLILNFSPTAFGWTGVFLFLIISGFLIHLGYLKNESDFNLRTFYSKRFWRIYPTYWLTLIFFAFSTGGFWLYFFYKSGTEDFLLHFFTLHNLTDRTFFSINGSYWSLALEVQLYLLYPVLLFLRQRIGMKNAFVVLILLSLMMILAGISAKDFALGQAYSHSIFHLWFVWATGAFLAELYVNGDKLFNKSGLLIAIFSLVLLIGSRYFVYTNYFSAYLATLLCAGLFDWFLHDNKTTMDGALSKLLINIGLCSYSIYLIHQPFLKNMVNFFNIISNKHITRVLNVVPAFVIVFLASWTLYQFVELPSIAFGNKLRKRKENR